MAQFGITKITKDRHPNTYRMIAKTSKKPSPTYYQVTYVKGKTIIPVGYSFRNLADAKTAARQFALKRLNSRSVEFKMI